MSKRSHNREQKLWLVFGVQAESCLSTCHAL